MVIKLRSTITEQHRPGNIIYQSEKVLPPGTELKCNIEHWNEDFRAIRTLNGPNLLRVKDEDSIELWSQGQLDRTLSGQIINDAQEGRSNYQWVEYQVLENKLPVTQELKIRLQDVKFIATLGFFADRYATRSKLIWEPSGKER